MNYPVNPESKQPVNNYRKSQKPRTKHPNAKLSWSQVREIRSLHAQGVTIDALTSRFGMSKTAIKSIVSGRTWKEDPALKLPPETGE